MSSLWLAFFSAATATGSPFIGFLYEEVCKILIFKCPSFSLFFKIMLEFFNLLFQKDWIFNHNEYLCWNIIVFCNFDGYLHQFWSELNVKK